MEYIASLPGQNKYGIWNEGYGSSFHGRCTFVKQLEVNKMAGTQEPNLHHAAASCSLDSHTGLPPKGSCADDRVPLPICCSRTTHCGISNRTCVQLAHNEVHTLGAVCCLCFVLGGSFFFFFYLKNCVNVKEDLEIELGRRSRQFGTLMTA